MVTPKSVLCEYLPCVKCNEIMLYPSKQPIYYVDIVLQEYQQTYTSRLSQFKNLNLANFTECIRNSNSRLENNLRSSMNVTTLFTLKQIIQKQEIRQTSRLSMLQQCFKCHLSALLVTQFDSYCHTEYNMECIHSSSADADSSIMYVLARYTGQV